MSKFNGSTTLTIDTERSRSVKAQNKSNGSASLTIGAERSRSAKIPNPKQKVWLFVLCTYFGFCALCFGFLTNSYALNLDKLKINFLEGDYKAAILEGEKILATQTDRYDLDELYYLLGLSYLKDGNYLRSSDIFEIILKEFKDSGFEEEAQLGLGDSYFLRGEYERAELYYKELLAKNPQTKLKAQVYYRLAQAGFKKGDKDQGAEYLNRLKQDFPLSPEVRLDTEIRDILDPYSFYYTVQVGAFSQKINAQNLTQKLTQQGYPAFMEEVVARGEVTYRVKVGELASRQEALVLEKKLSQEGYPTKICP